MENLAERLCRIRCGSCIRLALCRKLPECLCVSPSDWGDPLGVSRLTHDLENGFTRSLLLVVVVFSLGIDVGISIASMRARGKPLWRRRISRTGNNDVNATALIAGTNIITANNAGVVVCYDIENGKTIWRQTVDGPCSRELLRAGSQVIVGAISLYALNLQTGVVRYRLSFPNKAVGSITVAGKRVVAAL